MERKQADHKRLNALLGLAEAQRCRRQTLLAYFGETLAEPCGNCDLCRDPPETFDATEAARMAFSAILRTGESFGAEHLIAILRGEAHRQGAAPAATTACRPSASAPTARSPSGRRSSAS